ncbi:ATP-binding protein [Pandoraea sp.]|uniref:sensor histidine kinase n=1 Tax=Pandoraea sp. TaxID=1883445 RepID=UPI0025F3452A|nr:ATP-binding protein [Pandoraea sp.]
MTPSTQASRAGRLAARLSARPWVIQGIKVVLLLSLITTGAWRVYLYAERTEIGDMRDSAKHRLDIYESAVTGAIARYDYLTGLLNLNPDVIALLQHPNDPVLIDKVNRYLAAVNADARTNTLYVMDLQGTTLAASNWNTPISFVGANFSFRPYFIDAMKNGRGTFYGLGTTSKQAGYFYAERIYAGGKPIGVATAKIDLDKVEQVWKQSTETVMVADANGVVFLTSFPGWKFKALHPLAPQAREEIAATRQYNAPGALELIGLRQIDRLSENASIVALPAHSRFAASASNPFRPEYLLVSRPVSGTDWHIMILSNITAARVAARNAAFDTALGLAFVSIAVLYVLQRRRIISQRLAMEETLQRLNDELERKVARRTEALSRLNNSLRSEITRHKQTEETLKATLEELVQAGKMAALGQMSAGVTHELNQPLAALRTLSDNALMFLERGRTGETQDNLRMISELIERMGKITAQLKRFARKSPPDMRAVSVDTAISNALFLIEPRLRKESVTLDYDRPSAPIHVLADANRLEQVLVNLFANALDAMAHSEHRQLSVIVRTDGERSTITVRDTGDGLSEAAQAHLFEPFFTTKAQGAGLGLGLAISAGILREFGGTLRGANWDGGAEFIVTLRTAAQNDALETE